MRMTKSRFTMAQLQEESLVWVTKNFGTDRRPLLGLVEELGELAEASLSLAEAQNVVFEDPASAEARTLRAAEADYADAIADIVIFAADFSNIHGLSLQQAWDDARGIDAHSGLGIIAVGKLCHHELKLYQRIRGSEQAHKDGMQAQLAQLLAFLESACDEKILPLVERTWAKVKQRDWTKERAARAAAAESPQ
jgi:hypothetical protein